MRIKQVAKKQLFGMFNHEIPFNTAERITIIHSPNGFGKTVLLTMLNALFASHYHDLRRVPFGELSVEFEDSGRLKVKRKLSANARARHAPNGDFGLVFQFRKRGSKVKSYEARPIRRGDMQIPLRIFEEVIPGLERVGPETWFYPPTQELLSLEGVLSRFRGRMPFAARETDDEPQWLRSIIESVQVRFIEAQRLLSFASPARRGERGGRPSVVPAVADYSEELAAAIQDKLAQYASLSQSLDRTFPSRLVKEPTSSQATIKRLKAQLSELEKKRSRLVTAGLLDKEEEIDLKDLKIDESNRKALSLYIEDVKKKLGVFDELTNKIDLLVKNINTRFLYKQMSIGKKDGFILTTSEGRNLAPATLSSGEQHELVLFYELLFKVSPNSLILIDEPELSLHVAWQQQFLRDLQGIAKTAGFDVLIATHSPQIIHDRWDLTVKLEGPANARPPHPP